ARPHRRRHRPGAVGTLRLRRDDRSARRRDIDGLRAAAHGRATLVRDRGAFDVEPARVARRRRRDAGARLARDPRSSLMSLTSITFVTLVLLLLLVMPCSSEAQASGKFALVGVLYPGGQPLGPLEAFRDGLRERGYVEGRNLKLEWRFGEGHDERLPRL